MWRFVSSGGSRVAGVISDQLSTRLLSCLFGGPYVELFNGLRITGVVGRPWCGVMLVSDGFHVDGVVLAFHVSGVKKRV